ncbi:MAG: hypothetical protein ACOYIG_05275 [Acetivibrionales bacterium]|nr:hypothetical protein [Clostridiaceae bacterium]
MDNKISKNPYTRKGPDLILRMIDIFSVILWGFIIVVLAIILLARPVGETFFDRLFNIKVRDYWNYYLLQFSLMLSLVQLIVSVFSLSLNLRRLKRKGDTLRVSILASIFTSLAVCVILTLFLFM